MHLIVSTHALGDLPIVMESIRRFPSRPRTVVVSCDAVCNELANYTRDLRARLACPVVLVQRAHKGVARRSQTRNNGVRAIRRLLNASEMLYFLDGDICPDARHFQAVRALASCDVIIGRVVRLSQAASAAFKSWGLAARPFSLPLGQGLAFTKKVAKAKVATWLRRLEVPCLRQQLPAYWPDLRSGNFAVRADAFFRVNGFDEAMVGWGAEDSDLGRRLYSAGARVTTFPWGCRAYHLWHPSCAPARSSAQLKARLSATGYRPTYGLETPFEQAEAELQITT